MKKIKINTASLEDLGTIPGIGEAAAKKIIAAREKGTTINGIEELLKVGEIQQRFKNQILDKVTFEIEQIPKERDLTITNPIFTSPILINSFRFRVKFKGLLGKGDSETPNYRLTVGYKYFSVGGRISRSKSKQFAVIDGIANVSIPKSSIFSEYLSSTFDILLASSKSGNVFNSSFKIEEGEEIEVEITTIGSDSVLIDLDKKRGHDYRGYILTTSYRIIQGDTTNEYTKDYEINNVSQIEIDDLQVGTILDFSIEVKSPIGIPITNIKKDWEDIESEGNIKKIKVDLPIPTELDFKVQITPDENLEINPYSDHKVIAVYEIKDPDSLNFIKKVEDSFLIDSAGKATILIKHFGLIEIITLQVKAPSGEIIGNEEILVVSLEEGTIIEIKVPPKKLSNTNGLGTLPMRPKKTIGRVIDATGKQKFEDVKLIVYVAEIEDPTDEDYYPLLVTSTETDGYFVIDTPRKHFTAAFGKVIAPNLVDDNTKIRLEEDKVTTITEGEEVFETKLFFPAKVILVVNSEEDNEGESKSEDCNCNDCENLDFHQPKKVLEEYSFYSVVRTTEPDIQGFTLKEDGELTIQEIVETIPISNDYNTIGEVSIPTSLFNRSIRKDVLLKTINKKRGLTFTTLTKALHESNAIKLRDKIKPLKEVRAIGRNVLDLDNQIDWDEEPTIYQATTLAHGHLLHFKQEFINDGYSLGDLLYSLPLAPGQKKQIVVFDWERKESASRSEELDYQEELYNSLQRDRDILEVVQGSLSENVAGGSTARSSSSSAGFGLGFIGKGFGGLLGVSGGSSKASSSAWQNSSRNVAQQDLQKLRDRTIQSANGVRGQRATVIQTATQGERFSVETESIANYNHCHSITIEYFEVLRHLKIQQRLSDVQECLFIPLIMSTFDNQKILRWREILRDVIPRRRLLRRGFNAIERIENDYEGSDLPEGIYAEEAIEYLEGYINLKFQIARPKDNDDEFEPQNWGFLGKILPGLSAESQYKNYLKDQENKDEAFQENIAPRIAEAFTQNLKFSAIVDSGSSSNESAIEIPIDATLVSNYRNNRTLYVSLGVGGELPILKRSSIKFIEIHSGEEKISGIGFVSLKSFLPSNSKVIVWSGSMNYRTRNLSSYLFRNSRIQNDLTDDDNARIYTPLNRRELRNPRNEDLEAANALQDHLNDNLEYYHKAIWMSMSPERRFMFLDGIQVTDFSEKATYPLGVVRSVASVVDNKVIGVIGNSLVMPVAPGFRLDPNIRGEEVDFFNLYNPLTPIEPINISLPTKGVFAESVMGQCNSCEKKDEERFWRWSEEPIPDSPTGIQTISTDSRRSDPGDLTPTPFPNPVVNIQNAPPAPDPTGLSTSAGLLGASSFGDITGLSGNQQNALEALKASFATTQAFGKEAANLTKFAKLTEMLGKGQINKDEFKEMANDLNENNSDLGNLKDIEEAIKNKEISPEIGKKLNDAKLKEIENKANKTLSKITEPNLQDAISSFTETENASLTIEDNGQKLDISKGTGGASDSALITKIGEGYFDKKENYEEIQFGYEVFEIKHNKDKSEIKFDLYVSNDSSINYYLEVKCIVKVYAKYGEDITCEKLRSAEVFDSGEIKNVGDIEANIQNLGFGSIRLSKPDIYMICPNLKTTKFYIGKLNAKINPGTLFSFPFPTSDGVGNNEFICTQPPVNGVGSEGNTTHISDDKINAYAVDFAMPIGTEVFAIRDGIVVEVIDEFENLPINDVGSTSIPLEPIHKEKSNKIMVQHSDGTLAIYGHLNKGISVEKGNVVTEGVTMLGESGNSGYSDGPHLHVTVSGLRSDSNLGIHSASLPFKFKALDGKGVTPEKGKSYRRI